jgi:phosphomannomutase/phosphoglucomutase
MNPELFREYDIRGIADTDLADDSVETLGRGLGTYFVRHGVTRVTLGRDVRLSSTRLRNALARGLTRTGLTVIDIGVCPTPLLYYSLHRLTPGAGVMITGSHNPPEYNGFKIALGTGTIYGAEIQKVRKIVEAADFTRGEGNLESASLMEDYRRHIQERIPRLGKRLKVVVDSGNGTAGLVAPTIYSDLGCEVRELYSEPDGRFPNHHPDPTIVENLQDLMQAVHSSEADLGIAFDGDTDRIGVVDDEGGILWGDQLMMIYAREILERRPGTTFVAEVKCSKSLYQDIEARGGRAVMWKAGHSLIKAKMKEEGAVLGGEMSGHMFFADRYFGYDDAIYAGARLLEILATSGRRLSQLLADVPPTFSTPEIRMDCPEDLKFRIVGRAQSYFSRNYETVDVDGVRIVFPDGWGLVRASNTQPVLVLRFEADSSERLEEIQNLVEGKLEELSSGIHAS